METSEKPVIKYSQATVPVKKYGTIVAQEKEAIAKLQQQIKDANTLKRESRVTMMSRRRKRT